MKKLASCISSFKSDQGGFTLLEVGLVLAVLGVLGMITLPIMGKYSMTAKRLDTHNRQEQIISALGAYAIRYGSLPCPSPDLNGQFSNQCSKAGFVPYHVLGLDSKSARDGFGKPMTYAVDGNLGITDWNGGINDFCGDFEPQLKVFKGPSQQVLTSNTPRTYNFVAAVIVSHGKNSPQENTNGDLVFLDYPYSVSPTNPFEDKVKWISRDNLMAHIAKSPCQRSKK